jgi:hypothetical protein
MAGQIEATFQREHARLAGVVRRTTQAERALDHVRASLGRLIADPGFSALIKSRGLNLLKQRWLRYSG